MNRDVSGYVDILIGYDIRLRNYTRANKKNS